MARTEFITISEFQRKVKEGLVDQIGEDVVPSIISIGNGPELFKWVNGLVAKYRADVVGEPEDINDSENPRTYFFGLSAATQALRDCRNYSRLPSA